METSIDIPSNVLFSHEQRRMPQICYRIEQCGFAYATCRALVQSRFPKRSPQSQVTAQDAEMVKSFQGSLLYP